MRTTLQGQRLRGRLNGTWTGDWAVGALGPRAGMLIAPSAADRYRWVRRHALRGVRTLDAGCGSGWFTLYVAGWGNETIGGSNDPPAIAAGGRAGAPRGGAPGRPAWGGGAGRLPLGRPPRARPRWGRTRGLRAGPLPRDDRARPR